MLHRSATANLHARNTEQNPHFSGTTTSTTTTTGTLPTRDNFLYYYHPDHLGSTSHVTDADGKLYEHIEYFPFGESWVEEKSNTQRTPYLFTGKELVEETGLYYFGARYYEPRTGVWQSADRILWQYKDRKPNEGVFNSGNLSLYSYGYHNPIIMREPDGNCNVGNGRVDCFGPQWQAYKQVTAAAEGAWHNGEYGTAAVGAVIAAAQTVNVAAGIIAQGIVEPGNASYEATSGFVEGNYDKALHGSVETLLIFGGAKLLSPPTGATAGAGASTSARGAGLVIGRTADLKATGALRQGEYTLLDRLSSNLGSPKANWARNAWELRAEMNKGVPIRDASPGDIGGPFLNAERNLLQDRGWTFDPKTNYWNPPAPVQ